MWAFLHNNAVFILHLDLLFALPILNLFEQSQYFLIKITIVSYPAHQAEEVPCDSKLVWYLYVMFSCLVAASVYELVEPRPILRHQELPDLSQQSVLVNEFNNFN